ncbi:15801_t:CDS:2 [Funneliformis caledonium]|uniref:15801_t:CDS:1 n=1 Tax=Funneliformis caledonium TaxID=1117310 RepID=A0A9N8Z7U9_9GLOM|nr:15801_t:CDS:2 [Funneliformis caledonium]
MSFNNKTQQQYHSQNPYPATVISSDADFRLAQKLQDEEYARWVESNPQQEPVLNRAGESSVGPHLPRAPMPPIPEHYQYNHHQQFQNSPSYQSPIVYASPNQPPLPYSQTSPYANNGASGGANNQPYYGSLNQAKFTISK